MKIRKKRENNPLKHRKQICDNKDATLKDEALLKNHIENLNIKVYWLLS
jgi:hypothetical protein